MNLSVWVAIACLTVAGLCAAWSLLPLTIVSVFCAGWFARGPE